MQRWRHVASLTALLGIHRVAVAEPYSTDIELVRPTFSQGHLFGVESPATGKQGSLRYGTFLQYEREPLIVYEFIDSADEMARTVVANRNQLHLGVSYNPYTNMGVVLTVPVSVQWGGDGDDLSPASNAGLGDIGAGFRWKLLDTGPAMLGFRGDLYAPTGTRVSYLGEETPRFVAGLLASLGVGPAEVLTDASVMTREAVPTEEDFVLRNEVALSGGARTHLSPDKLAIGLSLITRQGMRDFFSGGAENTLELVGGTQLWPDDGVQVDLGVGRGLVEGYGSTKLRVVAGLTFSRVPPEKPIIVPPPIYVHPIPPVVGDDLPPVFNPTALAVRTESKIVVRDPIQFELGTAMVLPESFDTLDYVADLLNRNAQIAHLLIEGHASEEGTYEYNFALSLDRANAIWKHLVTAGVHPARLSTRGMGEVVPVALGSTDGDIEANRRVEFHIIRTLTPFELAPDYPETIQIPWTGQQHEMETPTEPQSYDQPVERPDQVDDSLFVPTDE